MDLLGPAGDISPALLTSQPPGSILCGILGFWDIQDPAVLTGQNLESEQAWLGPPAQELQDGILT